MRKIRTIKPEFWDDEILGQLSPLDRLLFLGMISLADDEGRMKGNPIWVRNQIFAYDETITVDKVTISINNLHKIKRIRVYGSDTQTYIEVLNFNKHQYIKRPQKSIIPPCSKTHPEKIAEKQSNLFNHFSNTPNSREILPHGGQVADTWRSGGGREGKGREGNIVLTYSSIPEEPTKPTKDLQTEKDCDTIFSTWMELFNKPASTKLIAKRKKAMQKMLKKYTAQQLVDSITGYASDPWRREELSRHELATLLRDESKVEVGLDKLANNKPTKAASYYGY